MNIREGVFDRIEDSFNLFKDNFLGLFLPFFLYNFISIVVVGTISKYYMMKSIAGIENMEGMDFFSFLNDSTVVIAIIIGMILFILYLLFYIVILLGFIKSVKQAVDEEKITRLDNVKYGFSRFSNSMKTYWYIFAYIALIPSIIFIIGGILFNLGFYYSDLEILKQIGGGLIAISLIIFIFFALYRGIKATFSIYSAVNENSFNKENFNNSLEITNGNWWRILGNFMLVGILVSLIMSLIGGIIGIVSFFGSGGVSLIDGIMDGVSSSGQTPNINDFKILFDSYISNFSIIGELISNTIDNILTTISSIFLLIFTYTFFIRLKEESNSNSNSNSNIEL